MLLTLCCLLLLGLTAPAMSQDEDLMDFDLADILNMDVTTVSKKAESISDAPAIISVMTAQQIEELGVLSLSELMSYVPGFSVKDTYWGPDIVTARGVQMTLYNDKILMLINGENLLAICSGLSNQTYSSMKIMNSDKQ